MEFQDAVTVFLHHRGRLLLLRRSEEVGTYRGRWAGVSGYLEAEPAEQAYQEIREETSLGPDQIGPLRAGASLEVVDEENGRAWRVHPFLAEVKEPSHIRLDWESAEMRWVLPEEVAQMETVPALVETLKRVWP